MNGLFHIKVVLTGEAGVSKTSIFNAISSNKRRRNVSESELIVHVSDRDVILDIWDTCGEFCCYSLMR